MDETTAPPMGDPGTELEKKLRETQLAEGQPEQQQTAQKSTITDFMSNPDVMAYIDKKVAEGIQQALKGTPPKASTANPSATEIANFGKMSYKERLKLFQSNPQAYQKLAKGSV
jgi:hypothetical protein